LRDIAYVDYVDSRAYDLLRPEHRAAVSRAVARVSAILEGQPFLSLSPGRCGTNDPQLGV